MSHESTILLIEIFAGSVIWVVGLYVAHWAYYKYILKE